jgi:hypothetical protein
MHIFEAELDFLKFAIMCHIFVHFDLALQIVYEGMSPTDFNRERTRATHLQQDLGFRYDP